MGPYRYSWNDGSYEAYALFGKGDDGEECEVSFLTSVYYGVFFSFLETDNIFLL